jgi:Ca2+-binding EF-hand superfamily protein
MKYTLTLILALLAVPAFGDPVPSKKQSAKAVVFTKLFNEADADRNGLLNEAEFGRSYGASDTPVVTEFRFKTMAFGQLLRANRAALAGVYLDEFIRQNGGRRLNPNRFERFLYADDDQDGFLDPEEFVATRVAPSAARGNVAQAFNKLDKNDDSLISPSEWGGFKVD